MALYFGGDTRFTHLASGQEAVQAVWPQIAPFALHDAATYSRWNAAARQENETGACEPAESGEDLAAGDRYRVVTPEQYVDELRTQPVAIGQAHPMTGGIPPELAWPSLRLIEHEVLPGLR
ncbi:hypothetical protein [Frankia sp. R43]|uniref:hypothetical protein n=1 Tax=Frankia sp. R43 TaxID=269536 RepID=UPI0006C9F7F1|nr:hypothetical protein [Frankia sp. R43]